MLIQELHVLECIPVILANQQSLTLLILLVFKVFLNVIITHIFVAHQCILLKMSLLMYMLQFFSCFAMSYVSLEGMRMLPL